MWSPVQDDRYGDISEGLSKSCASGLGFHASLKQRSRGALSWLETPLTGVICVSRKLMIGSSSFGGKRTCFVKLMGRGAPASEGIPRVMAWRTSPGLRAHA